jgi:2-iminobutanoate/2-iminopropanoate deaminase
MERVPISTQDGAPHGLPFSPSLQVSDWVFLSGQGSINADNEVVGDTIEEQTEKTLHNVERLLEAAGCRLADVVSVLVHLADLSTFERYNRVYERFFPDPKPVRTTRRRAAARWAARRDHRDGSAPDGITLRRLTPIIAD